MQKDIIIYVDFDSTLYDTPRFAQDMWNLVAQEANISTKTVAEDALKYFADPNLGGYDYEKHISSYDLDADTMWLRLKRHVAGHDYLYEDSPQFIQSLCEAGFRPHILSFGEKRFQTIKIQASLEKLRDTTGHKLGFDIVMRKKREHILDNHQGKRGFLIDDKPDQDLPRGFTEITINRSLNLIEPQQTGSIYTVSNLLQAIEIINP
jgi:hypothetical protein